MPSIESAAAEIADQINDWAEQQDITLPMPYLPLVLELRKLIAPVLTRHFGEDSTPIDYDEVEAMFADEAVTVSQRNGQVGVCVDFWVPIRTRGDAERLKAALGIPAPQTPSPTGASE